MIVRSYLIFIIYILGVFTVSADLLIKAPSQACILLNEVNLDTRRLSENRKPTAEKPFRPDFPLIFVTRTNYLYQMVKKSDSK